MQCRYLILPGPSLEGRHDEEREHGVENVVVVELAALPQPLLHDGLVDVPVLVGDELALARVVVVHAQVRADEELPLEQLHTDDGKHELKQRAEQVQRIAGGRNSPIFFSSFWP